MDLLALEGGAGEGGPISGTFGQRAVLLQQLHAVVVPSAQAAVALYP